MRLLLVAGLGLGPAAPAGAVEFQGAVSVPSRRAPLAPDLSATKTDSLLNDVDSDGLPDPGDTLRYTVVVTNAGSTDALGVVVSDTLDANTSLSGAVLASPLALADSYTATEDAALVIAAGAGVLANDFGQPAPAAVAQAAAPTTAGGSVTLSANGSFTYNPPAGYTGPDSFSYDASNSSGTDSGLVSITVAALPVAANDAYNTVQDTPLVVPAATGVLDNDTPNGATISAYAAATSQGGSVSLALDGGFIYTPTAGFFSPPTDTFTYTLSNAVGNSTATVSITVDLPGPPVAVDDTYTATANTPLNVPAAGVLANDTVNSASLSDFAATTSQGGTVSVNADGSFSYDPPADFISPPVDTFTYTLSNALGNSTAGVTITVLPPAAPVAVNDSYTTTANTPLSVPAAGVLGNDTVNFATISDYAATSAEGGSVGLNADGSFDYTPPTNVVSPPADTFTYTLSNALGSDTATVSVNVQPPGAPVAADDVYTTTVNTPLVVAAGGVLSNDSVNFAAISDYAATTAQGGSVGLAADGSFVYTPTTDFVSPPTDTFTYTLTNALGSDTATVTLTVNPAGPPVAEDDLYTTTANTVLNVPAAGVLGNDTVNFASLSDYAATTALGGSVALEATGAFTYTPPVDTVRPPNDSFTYTLTNGLGSDTATVQLAIDPPGTPVAVADTYTATASTTLSVPAAGVLANDTTNFATINAFQATSARGGTVVLDATGAFTYTAPSAVSPPDDTFTYTLSNALGNSTATVTLELFPPAPPVAVNDSYTATADTPRAFAASVGVLANDTLNFGTLTDYQATTTLGGSVTLAASGAFTYTPPSDQISPPNDTFTYTVSNALGDDTATVTIQIYPPPPNAVNDSYTATGHITITVPAPGVLANDTLNFGALSGAAITSTQGGNVSVNANGSFSYQSAPGFEGTDTFTYTLSNITASDTATVTVNVGDVIWFVDNTAGAGDGRLGSPYNSLAPLQGVDVDDPGDAIFVYQGAGAYTGGLVLENNQALLGQGVGLGAALPGLSITLAPNSAPLPGAGGSPSITHATGHGVTLGTGNTLRGLTLGTTSATSFALSGASFVTLNVDTTTISSGAGGLSLTTGTANVTLSSLGAAGGTNGVYLSGVNGTLNLGLGALSGASGATFSLAGGSATVSYSGSLTQTNNAPLVNVASHASGTLTFSGSLNASAGTGLQLDNADGTYNFSGTTTLNGGDAGIDIVGGSSGTFNFPAGTSITNPSGPAFSLSASPANVTYSGQLSANSGFLVNINDHDAGTITFQTGTFSSTGQGVRVQNSGGGTINFNNPAKTLNTGVNPAVMLTNNAGATINFNNGSLDIDTTSGAGFSASGGGTINVAGANNTVNSGTGTGVSLSGTGGALLFHSVSANGAPNGLSLTDTTGSFEVSGDGASDSANTTRGRTTARLGGGSVVLGSGGTVAGTTGAAVLLSNTDNVTLRNMTLSTASGGSVNDGRDGVRVSNNAANLTLDNVLINGSGNGLANNSGLDGSALAGLRIIHTEVRNTATAVGVEGADVWGVDLTNLTGTASVLHSIFDTARENVFGLVETGNATLSLTVTNSLFQNANLAGVGNNGLGIAASNTANVSVTVDGSSFLHFWGNGFQYVGNDQSGGGLIELRNSTFDDDGSSINIAHQGQGKTLRFNIRDNHVRDTGIAPGAPGNALNAINLLLGEQADASSKLEGYLTGNTIGNAGLAFSGSAQGNGVRVATFGAGTLTVVGSGNTIRQIQQDHAFWAFASKQSAAAGVGTINLTLTNNNFSTDTNSIGLAGLGINAGNGAFAGDSPTICANLLGNTRFSGDPSYAGIDLTLLGTSPTVNLVGYGGAPNDIGAITTFLSSAAVATTVSPAPLVTIGAGSVQSTGSCPTPGFTQAGLRAPNVMGASQPGARGGLLSARPALAPSAAKLARLVSAVQFPALAPAADLVQVNVGTLPASKSVTITFDVVIGDPLPPGTTTVSNQAEVSGSNFARVLSDDPDTAAAGDPTVTVLAPPELFTLYLPVVANQFVNLPDLVSSVSLNPNQTVFGAGEQVTVTVVITNVGTAPAGGFWVDLYLNPSSAPTQANQVWDSLCALSPCYGIAWRVDGGLDPGESLTLTSTPASYWAPNTIWPGYFAGGTTDLYVYADSFGNPSVAAGAVLEGNEANNRAELHGLSVPSAAGAQSETARDPQDLPQR